MLSSNYKKKRRLKKRVSLFGLKKSERETKTRTEAKRLNRGAAMQMQGIKIKQKCLPVCMYVCRTTVSSSTSKPSTSTGSPSSGHGLVEVQGLASVLETALGSDERTVAIPIGRVCYILHPGKESFDRIGIPSSIRPRNRGSTGRYRRE